MNPSLSLPIVSVRMLDLPYPADREYQYVLPESMRGSVRTGTMLVVPFGRSDKQMTAVAVGFSEKSEYPRLKEVLKILDYPFSVPEEAVSLCMFMKNRFFCTFGQAFRTVLPPGINVDTETYYTLAPAGPEGAPAGKAPRGNAALLLRMLEKTPEMTDREISEALGEQAGRTVASLLRSGRIEKRTRVPETINEKTVTALSLACGPEEVASLLEDESRQALTPKQKTLVELLTHYPCATLREVASVGGIGPGVVDALVRKGIVEKTVKRLDRTFRREENVPSPREEPPLTEEQEAALKTIQKFVDSGELKAFLLYGVTGSGKTRVIIEAVRKVLAKGKSAIVLLPEIGLTAQAMSVYRAAFGDKLAVVHSMLSIGERLDACRAMREGTVRVVLGTRSAVFSPVLDLGLIVLDEEQESTYKSENAPRYHARDIARFRCKENKALMLLSSATPSVESYFKAREDGPYKLLKLTRRVGEAQLPDVVIEDLRNDRETGPDRLIGARLDADLKRVLKEGRQAILFSSRRGYQSHVACRSCGHPFQCPSCSVSLTYHAFEGRNRLSEGKLLCHYCGYTAPVPSVCPVCGKPNVGRFGFGTQMLQEELEERYPEAKVARMDTDTTSGRDSHEQILSAFGRKESDILCGTQMITKGLNFPSVDLVGVISADSLLYQADFRAGEKTFSLITQLVGRAGRADRKGSAVLQTYNPGNEILQLAAKQDYEKFYESEKKLREAVHFPPFCSLLTFTISSTDESACEQWADKVASLFSEMYPKAVHQPTRDLTVRALGPYPCALYKVGNRYRRCILFKYSDRKEERAFFAELLTASLCDCPKDVRVDPDANPVYV